MTTPAERTKAVLGTRDFLEILSRAGRGYDSRPCTVGRCESSAALPFESRPRFIGSGASDSLGTAINAR